MRLSHVIISLALPTVMLGIPITVFASAATPSFPSCLNSQHTAEISYSNGYHGIAGDTSSHTGSDSVYKLEENNQVLQCFCGSNGQGIQTNWIKVDTLSAANITSLEGQGWIYVPYGSDWGLDNAAYLAQNTPYTCLSIATVQPVTLTNTANGSSLSDGTGGNALVALANTGNSIVLFGAIIAGVLSLSFGIFLKPKKS